MREILFRGKQKDNGKWIQGYLFCIWEKSYILWGTTNGIPNMVEVDPKTIGQWTGLVDKRGVKIFEGEMAIYLRDADEVGEIRWDDNDACFYLLIENVAYTFSNIAGDCLEVIGNIHDKAVEE